MLKKLPFLFCFLFFFHINPIFAKTSLHISTKASIEILPDFLHMQISIEKTNKSAQKAKQEVDNITKNCIEVIKALKIKAEDIDAANITIQPEYDWINNERIFKGQKVNRNITFRLNNISLLNQLVTKISALPISQLQIASYGFNKPEELSQNVLVMAIGKAQDKAEVVAKKLNKSVIEIEEIKETPRYFPIMGNMLYQASGAQTEMDKALEVKPQKIESSIDATFILD